MIGRVQKFCSEVAVELKKVSWSSKKEVVDATWIVLISSFFLGSFIAVCDFVLSKMLGLLIK
ncbi:MAG: preprotein translocase subunit SecE [Candidatus Omnitrophica bacterium]|nr:preprotein translocase subunit SecE [Candidatus Omnitrophota bacterium]